MEVLAGTLAGTAHRARVRDLMDLVILESHSAPGMATSFNETESRSDRFVTVAMDGTMRSVGWCFNSRALRTVVHPALL